MTIFKKQIKLQSKANSVTFLDVTEHVKNAINESGIENGVVHVISPHTTCSVFFEEFDHDFTDDDQGYLNSDLNDALESIIPTNTHEGQYRYPGPLHYEAVLSWPNAESYIPKGDRTALLNADAHLKSSILGSSETFEVDAGKLAMGTTGYIYFVDFDQTRERTRTCRVVVMGA